MARRKTLLATVSILLLVVLALVGAYFVRWHMLETAMISAMERDDKAAVAQLAHSLPCPVNARGKDRRTPLHWAAIRGDGALAALLAAKGADINAKQDNDGWTPLNWAVANGHKEVVEFLIAKGAKINAKDNVCRTPLHWAAYHGEKEIAELLIGQGAEVNAKDNGGWTPLYLASREGYRETCEVLIAQGADVNAKDNDGKTALQQAINHGHDDVAELLRKAGASAVKPMPIVILKYYRSPDRTECLEDPYGFLISWNNSETPRFYVYDASGPRIDATGDFTEFLHLLSAFPDGVRVRWVNGCCGGFCWDMPKDKYDAIEKLRAGKQWRYYDGEDSGEDYWKSIICTCETENVTFLEKAP